MSRFMIKRLQAGYVAYLYAANRMIIGTTALTQTQQQAEDLIRQVHALLADTPVQDQTARAPVAVPCPKFQIYNDNTGAFRFRLRNAAGDRILMSQRYATHDACVDAVKLVRSRPGPLTIMDESGRVIYTYGEEQVRVASDYSDFGHSVRTRKESAVKRFFKKLIGLQ